MADEVQQALLELVRKGRVVHSDISRQGISGMTVQSGQHEISVTWYPAFIFGRGDLRSLHFNGKAAPLRTRAAIPVLRAMQERAEQEFNRRSSEIIAAASQP